MKRGGLWENRTFNLLWLCFGLSSLGDAFANIGLPVLVLHTTGSLVQMGIVTGIIGAANFLSSAFGGPIVDRVDPRRLMFACHLTVGLLYVTIPIAEAVWGPSMGLVYVVCGVGTFLNHTFQLANVSATASTVAPDQISLANGRQQGTIALTFVVGFVIAGALSQWFGPALLIGGNGVLLLVSATCMGMWGPRALHEQQGTPADAAPPELSLAGLLVGVRFLKGHQILRWVMVFDAVSILAAVAALDLLIFRLKVDLGQDDTAIGVIFAIASVGSILGAVVATSVRLRFGFAVSFLGACLVKGLSLAALGAMPSVSGVAILALTFSFGQTICAVNANSLRQESTPDPLQGRVTAAYWTLTSALGPVAAVLAAMLARATDVTTVLIGMGITTSLVTVLGLFSPVRTAERPTRLGPAPQ